MDKKLQSLQEAIEILKAHEISFAEIYVTSLQNIQIGRFGTASRTQELLEDAGFKDIRCYSETFEDHPYIVARFALPDPVNEADKVGEAMERLFISTVKLHERFGTKSDVNIAWAVFAEEITELLHEVNKSFVDQDVDLVTREAVDCVVCLFGLLRALAIPNHVLIQNVIQVAEKNDQKTHKTHRINPAGKIARIK